MSNPSSPPPQTPETTGLPTPWQIRLSTSRNLPYYFNPTSQTSQWEPPTPHDASLLSAYMATHFSLPSLTPTSADLSHKDQIRCAHLLVKHSGSRNPSSWKTPREEMIKIPVEEAMEKLKGFEKRIREGEVSLGELAVRESDCSSARKRGDLGWFGRGAMQREFEDAAFELEVGEMTHPVVSQSGIHLIERLE